MTTAPNSAILDPLTNPVLTVAPQNKEDTTMSGATNKITALYCLHYHAFEITFARNLWLVRPHWSLYTKKANRDRFVS